MDGGIQLQIGYPNCSTQCLNQPEQKAGLNCGPHKKKAKGNYSHLFFSLSLLLLINFGPVSGKQRAGMIVTESDYQALRALKHEFIDLKGVLSSWNDTGPRVCLGWAGIKCVNGQVKAIQLPRKGLGGRISEKIGQLRALRRISLHDNVLTGPVPSSLGLLRDLRGVYLFNNRLSGSIPPSIGNCLRLQTLDVSNNQLSSIVPPSVAASTRLYRLNLSFNGISGPIPISLSRSPSLTFLALQHNNISGSIPDSWGCDESAKNSYMLQFLALDHNLLSGKIPSSLSCLKNLENLSLNNNHIVGNLPDELGNLSSLNFLDFSNNDLDGLIPESIEKLVNLSVLNLSKNKFEGRIPSSIGNITSMTSLDLSENNLTGEIPTSLINLQSLSFFYVSYNNLSGYVPSVLAKKFGSSSFIGNVQLCGYGGSTSTSTCPSLEPENLPSPELKHHLSKLSTKDIILISSGALLVILLILCCSLLCCLISKKGVSKARDGLGSTIRVVKPVHEVGPEGEMGGKLVHFDGHFVFTADDLLSATAEIMGKSTYGSTYKATLEDNGNNNQVAVKRLREKITKARKEFEIKVARLGKIRHPNILALRAYYIGPKEEKLLVYDYMPCGSLSYFLHARWPETSIPWPERIAIAIGTSGGLCHLHTKENAVHGNLTSSNILLDEHNNPIIADVGLSHLMMSTGNADAITTSGTTGYRAPELSKLKNASTKSDVFSLGVIMLELLTGKSPSEAIDGLDLTQWVALIVKEGRTNEVFDMELARDGSNIGEELLDVLKLALHCVDPSPVARPDIEVVLEKLEVIGIELKGKGEEPTSVDDGEAIAVKSE